MQYIIQMYNYITSSCKRQNKFQYLLETPKNYFFGMESIRNIDLNNELVKSIDSFCKENKVYENGALISLSGGVDSMVVMAILIKLSIINVFPIYAASINYNNREEQTGEIEFLEEYCKYYKVKLYVANVEGFTRKKDNSGSRTEYEEESRKVRFDLYHQIMKETNCTGVFVGHHKDDILENIFTNSMKGGNLLDLEVMKEISNIHDVNIFRPLLKYHKSPIYDLAHKHLVPYFLDTTPKWSRRGKMRNEIFPLFDNVFSTSWRVKLKDLGDQSNQWGQYINDYVLEPWVKSVKIGKYGFIMEFKNQPKLIYTNVILKVMHSLGKHMLKSSSVDKIVNVYNNPAYYDKQIILDSGMVMFVDSENPNYFLIFHKNEIQAEINMLNSETDITMLNREFALRDLMNGIIHYHQPNDNTIKTNTFSVNNKRYTQMNINLPIELMKIFTYPKLI